jgi:hypothetical protein
MHLNPSTKAYKIVLVFDLYLFFWLNRDFVFTPKLKEGNPLLQCVFVLTQI